MKPTWIQKGADIAKNINTEWGMTLKSMPFKAFPDMKEVFTRKWVEQSGEEEYLPATPVFKSYEMDVQFVYLGALDTAGEKIFKFCEYIAGSEVSLYDEFTKVGCRCRFVSYEEKAFYRRDEDAVQFSIKVKVNNPLCYAAKSNGLSEIRFAVPVKTVVYWSDGTATMHDASSTVAKTINGFGIVAPYSSAIAPATQVITPTPSQNGYTFTPHISPDGVLTFTNDGNLTNPNPLQLFSANKAVTDSITPDDLTKWNSVVGKENAGVAAQLVSDLKSGVSSEGDTLKKLYDLFVSAYSEVTVASISARDAYDIKKLPTSIFVLDDGDGKWALYKATTTGTNASYVKISDPDLLNATMTASQIKASYESVANAFTDAEKQKLAQQSGTNTGDQDLSGLEPKRGADDFYVTNAEKTQGALATGIANPSPFSGKDLSTLNKLANEFDKTNKLLVDYTMGSDAATLIFDMDRYGNLFSSLKLKNIKIIIGLKTSLTTISNNYVFRINNITTNYNIPSSAQRTYFLIGADTFVTKNIYLDIIGDNLIYTTIGLRAKGLSPQDTLIVNEDKGVLTGIQMIESITIDGSSRPFNTLSGSTIKIYRND